MGLVHLHLLVNHVPVVGALCGILLLAFAYARASSEIARFSFMFLSLLGAAGIVAYATGSFAEDAARTLPDVSASLVERHEEAALIGTVLMVALGAVTTFALWMYRRHPIKRKLTAAVLVAAIGVSSVMAYVGYLGGQIRHTEIRSSAGPVADLHEIEH